LLNDITLSSSQSHKKESPISLTRDSLTLTQTRTMAAPKLEKHFTMRIYLSEENIYDLGAMRNGPHRHIAAITRGFIKGEGLEAEILPGGADWVSV
jgi:hypothetical protein